VLHLLRVAPLLLVALVPASGWADIHDEFRACMYEYYPRSKKASAATAVTPADQFCLGFAYWSGTGPVPKDPAQSARWWGQAAREGHAGAQTMLAYQYGRGLGVARNDAEAVRLLRAAIAQGYGDGMFNLGRLYARGQGVPKSEAESRRWLDRALRAGSVDAAIALRAAREQELRKPAAEQAGAAYQAYRAGDLPRAVSLYRAAAEAGNAAAQETLGTRQGAARDPAAAVRLYRQAADRGYGRAQAQLGLAHEAGEGVAESWTEAHAWCLKRARQFDRDAAGSLRPQSLVRPA
jgi:TPR repeat protein